MAEPATVDTTASYAHLIAASKAAGDTLRADILRVLQKDSFGVLELSHISGVAQPALSHHLKILASAGLVAQRREGNTIFYRRALIDSQTAFGGFLTALFTALDEHPLPASLSTAIGDINARRSKRSREFFAANAELFADRQALISQPSVYDQAAIELLTGCEHQCVLEVRPGQGHLLAMLAREFASATGVDDTPEMLDRASAHIRELGLTNVRLVHRAFESLPPMPTYDAIVGAMVVHHNPSPRTFFEQAHKLLKPRGVLLVVELCRHDQEWVREACGDLWLGFDDDALDAWSAETGFGLGKVQYLAQKNGFRIQLRTYRNGT